MAEYDDPRLMSTGAVWRHLGIMDPEEFQSQFQNQLTPQTMQRLIGFKQSGAPALSPDAFDKYRMLEEQAQQAEMRQQGAVDPTEYMSRLLMGK